MAKVSKSSVGKGINKIIYNDLPLLINCNSMDYGFDKPVISLSIMEGLTGKPFVNISKSKITATAISSPNGWSVQKKLRVSPVHNKVDGCYVFTLSDKGNDLKKGPYTIAIHVKSVVARKVYRGQTLIQLRVK